MFYVNCFMFSVKLIKTKYLQHLKLQFYPFLENVKTLFALLDRHNQVVYSCLKHHSTSSKRSYLTNVIWSCHIYIESRTLRTTLV